MKTELIFVGKTVDKRFDTAIDDYIKRIEHYLPIKLTTIPALKNTKKTHLLSTDIREQNTSATARKRRISS